MSIHQPGTFNIEAWDGIAWRGGMNRLTGQAAIATAQRWSDESNQRYRVFDPAGSIIFDTADTGALAMLRKARVEHDRGGMLPSFGPVIDSVSRLAAAAAKAAELLAGQQHAVGADGQRIIVELRAALADVRGNAS